MRLINKTKSNFLLITAFFFFFFSKEIQVIAQPDFSNRIINTNCCPVAKQRIDSIMNNAPYVFEGRMIKMTRDTFYHSYLFEIEKVYRGGDKLQSGTIEIITRMPMFGGEPPLVVFSPTWHIIFAKEIDSPNFFNANNSLKLEVFFNNKDDITSYFTHVTRGNYCGSALSLNFKTKEEVRSFLTDYNLFPIDIPKADTLKTLSKREIEAANEKAIREEEKRQKDIEETARREEDKK